MLVYQTHFGSTKFSEEVLGIQGNRLNMEPNSLIHKPKRQKLKEEQGIDVDQRISVLKLHFLSMNGCQVMIIACMSHSLSREMGKMIWEDYCPLLIRMEKRINNLMGMLPNTK